MTKIPDEVITGPQASSTAYGRRALSSPWTHITLPVERCAHKPDAGDNRERQARFAADLAFTREATGVAKLKRFSASGLCWRAWVGKQDKGRPTPTTGVACPPSNTNAPFNGAKFQVSTCFAEVQHRCRNGRCRRSPPSLHLLACSRLLHGTWKAAAFTVSRLFVARPSRRPLVRTRASRHPRGISVRLSCVCICGRNLSVTATWLLYFFPFVVPVLRHILVPVAVFFPPPKTSHILNHRRSREQ